MTHRKNDTVYVISNWNEIGDFYYRRALVHSCGKKEMKLVDVMTGQMFQQSFRPDDPRVIKAADDATAIERARDRMAQYREAEIARLERLSNLDEAEAYTRRMKERLALIRAYTPRVRAHFWWVSQVNKGVR